MPRYFTKEHEWVEVDGGDATVGISDYAQSQLGDITFVDLPQEGLAVAQGEAVAVVDSVKAASDVYSPVSGTVSAVNGELEDQPELVNSAAETDGWLYRLTLGDAAELDSLMDESAYKDYVTSL